MYSSSLVGFMGVSVVSIESMNYIKRLLEC
jgi:hypothetical protein